MNGASGTGPLAGFRIVELGVWVAGPAAAGLLSDWGADVIKVEPPAGDPQRRIFGAVGVKTQSAVPPFESDNRGKRSVMLDLQLPEARESMERLLASADAFITNVRPSALRRLGLHHDDVLARHPRLVYASLTGYGLEGPDRDRAGYDVGAFWARSGLAHTIVPPGQLPPAIQSGMGDHITGLSLAAGVMAKLLERERTGHGGLVATSLLRTGMYALSWDIGIQLRLGRRASTRTRDRNPSPLVNSYQAADGRGFWLLLLEADRHWPKLIAAIGRPDLAADERFVDARALKDNSEAAIAALDAAFALVPYDELTAAFDQHDVWWAPISSIPGVIADPQAQAARGFVEMSPRDGEEPYRAVNNPLDFGGYEFRPGPVPTLGEHTAEVLGELG
ncbi:MAG: putative CoA-transferase [Ilumatobacteraceae bacterium]|nr:putative CoA-transferase [Ilumatobacteraceae bacterium]